MAVRVVIHTGALAARKSNTQYSVAVRAKVANKVNLVTFSPTGSSMAVGKLIGDAIAEVFDQGENGATDTILDKWYEGENAVIDLCAKGDDCVIGPETLCIFSVPCYGGRIPATAAERLSRVRGDKTAALVCVTFGNRAYEDALLELAECVEANGFRVVAACAVVTEHNIMHEFGKGRPDDADQAQIRKFAQMVAKKIKKGNLYELKKLPGNKPFKEWKNSKLPIEVNAEKCSNCGICAAGCPVGAVLQPGWKTDEDACIHCMRCVKYCPEGCRRVPEEVLHGMTERLRAACETRKENEFFMWGRT